LRKKRLDLRRSKPSPCFFLVPRLTAFLLLLLVVNAVILRYFEKSGSTYVEVSHHLAFEIIF
ncbi:MAG: hypothetical protein IIV81_00150, partial [Clostridia bacterium]|nr:hypothetical protein [Clostridia bacterium]